MVDFASPVQGQPSQPYFWARPTSEPKPDTSGEIRGKAIGQALDAGGSAIKEGAQGITAAYEKGIQNTVYAAVDPLRDQYMERLHSADQSLQGRDTPDPLGRDAPRDVKGLPDTLGKLDSARANGKLSQTDYDARLNALAKEVRGKYPGYREYVDETFKRVTGRDSANQYIRSVIQDVDSFTAARRSGQDKLANRILESGFKYKEGNMWYQKVQQDPEKYGPQALSWLNSMEAKDHSLEMATKLIDFEKASNTLNREKETDIQNKGVTESGAHYYSSKLDTIATHLDIDPKTNDRMQDIMNKMRRGEFARDVTPQESVQLRTFMEQQRGALSAERAADLSHAFPNMKTEEIQKTVADELKLFYDPYMDALGKGDFSLAEQQKNLIKAKSIEAATPYFDKDKYAHTHAVLTGLAEVKDPLGPQIAIQAGQQASAEQAGELMNNAAAAATSPSKGGKSFGQIAQEMQVKNNKDGKNWKSLVELYSTIATKGPQAISDESADALINSAFGPQSADVLKYFAKTGTGTGGKGLGQQYVYDTFTSEGMADRVAKRAKENPELYEHYRNWVGSNIRYLLADHSTLTDVPPEDTGRVSTVQQALRKQGDVTPFGKLRAAYNPDTSTFSFLSDRGMVNRPDLRALSSNLKRAADVAQKDPNHDEDPTVAVYQILRSMNAPEGSLVDQMIKAMVATHQ
jgi:hypothetical protein